MTHGCFMSAGGGFCFFVAQLEFYFLNLWIWVFSKNSGTPKSSILIGFSIINHPFWGTTIFGNTYFTSWFVLVKFHRDRKPEFSPQNGGLYSKGNGNPLISGKSRWRWNIIPFGQNLWISLDMALDLSRSGFLGTFDFLYLPIDPETNASRAPVFFSSESFVFQRPP